MATGKLVIILASIAAISGTLLSALTAFIAFKFRGDIRKGEKRRAVQKLRPRRYSSQESCDPEQKPELAAAGHR